MGFLNDKIFSRNRKYAFLLGLFSTLIWWYTMVLLTQQTVDLKYRQYIGLSLALGGYTLWFLYFSYTVESN